MFEDIWQYKIQVLPVFIFMIIYVLPSLLRRLKKTFYVPIYFSIYPLKEINQNLSTYLAEDYFICHGSELTPKEAEKLKNKIIFTSIVSSVIDVLMVPLLVGIIASFFLTKELFYQFLVTLFFYKLITILLSLKNSHYHFINSQYKLIFLTFIYIVYLGTIMEMLKKSYSWARPFVSTENWSGLWNSFSSIVFGTIVAEGIIFAILVAIFTNYIADRKIRDKNIHNDRC